jgi:hypothetical protein
VIGCSPSPYKTLQPVMGQVVCLNQILPSKKTLLYDTKVNVVGKHLSGLLLTKEMPDSSIRVVFTNEMGLKFFDFEFTHSDFKVIYCMPQLNKKLVIRQLKKDMSLLLSKDVDLSKIKIFQNDSLYYYRIHSGKEINYYITDKNCSRLMRLENSNGNHKKVIFNFTGFKNGSADSIFIAHQTFDFTISLKQLDR